jgi:hypothetical protein
MEMRLNLIGKGRGWEDAPPCNKDYHTWGITQLILRRKVDLVIDMNDYSDNKWGARETLDAVMARNQATKDGIPYIDLLNYPLKEIERFFKTDYFSSTMDYAVALAVYKGYEKIDFYGMNMEWGTDYSVLKSGIDFWCGYAMGKGVEIVPHGEHSTIMKTEDGLLYGYGTPQRRFMNG